MFKTFPEFSKLTLADRDAYESLIKDYPPISDLAFVSLMTLWSTLDTTRVSMLNDNLVISYWLPGDDGRSGLSLVGTNKIDQSICEIFDYLKEIEQPARLINVPQFVVDHIRYPESFDFDFKFGDEDCVVAFKRYAQLPNLPPYKRAKIKRFVKTSGNLKLESLDLSRPFNRKLLLDCSAGWPKKALNNVGKFEEEAFQLSMKHVDELSLKNLCLFEDGELIAYNLYYVFPNSKYLLVAHARLDYSIPHIFDYMTYSFSKEWLQQGLEFGNIHGDMGILRLRVLKIALRPVENFRKYTLKPAK